MFQNITIEENEQEEQKKETNKDKLKKLAKRTLTKQNIALYIIALMISMVGFSENIFPFGIAITVAACSIGIPIAILAIITTIGTLISFGIVEMIIHLMTLVVFITSIMIKAPETTTNQEENEKKRLAKHLFISCLIVQIIKIFTQNILIYNILEAIMFCIVAVIFYKIFVNSIGVVKDFGIKKIFSVEEMIGMSLTLAIAISAFGKLEILGISIRNVLCILMVLILGWKNGVLVGGTAGITIGVVLGIIGINEPVMIASFALSGMLAGILNRLGKPGVIIGFIIGNAILTYITNGNTLAIIHLREILVASVGLLLIPKSVEITIDDIIAKKHYLPVTNQRILEAHKDTIYKLNSMSETISEIAKTYEDESNKTTYVDEEEKHNYKIDLMNNISNLEDNILYEDIMSEENHILDDIYIALKESENEEITLQQLLQIFENHNNYIIGLEENSELRTDVLAILKAINYTYKINTLNYVWKQKMKESRKNVSKELTGVSQVISTIAEEMEEEPNEKTIQAEQQIKTLLKQKNIEIKDVKISKLPNGKNIIKIYTTTKEITNKTVEKILSKTIQQPQVHQRTEYLDENTKVYIYETADKYDIQLGISKIEKNNSKMSGDSFIKTKLKDGKILIAISDGMGSGEKAKKTSKIAITMLEKLLKEGFDKEASLNLINTTMVLNANEDMYATLDIGILDLYEGKLECIKNGACPTYIKDKETVEMIQSTDIPAGLLNNIDLVVYEKELKDGDIILMCSDGIIESNSQEQTVWVQKLLKQLTTKDAQKIADLVIREAIDNNLGIAKDDMTIIVAKVKSKNNEVL